MTEPIFDEAARLYAENFEIVSNAAEAYQRAAKSCVAALEKQTRSCLGRTSLGSFTTKKGNPHGYWWTGAGDWKNRVSVVRNERPTGNRPHWNVAVVLHPTRAARSSAWLSNPSRSTDEASARPATGGRGVVRNLRTVRGQ